MFAVFKTNLGEFKVKLHDQLCPNTVKNFTELAQGKKDFTDSQTGDKTQRPYYDGLCFHRIIPNFMIQGGCPDGTGMGGPGYQFEDEFHPELRHDKPGILSMANAGPNTNGSQFFITTVPTPHLDDRHSVFGEVVEGLDVISAIENVATGHQDKPVSPVIIETLVIEEA